jgi:hypothetical protein
MAHAALETFCQPVLMFRECPFCGNLHRSPYVDELEASVMACRDRVAPEARGSLEEWHDRDTIPVRPEVEATSVWASV